MNFFKKIVCVILIVIMALLVGINAVVAEVPSIPTINTEHKILYSNEGLINSVTVPAGKNMYTHGYRMNSRFENPFTDLSKAGYVEVDVYSSCQVNNRKINLWITNNYDIATVRGRIPLPELQVGWNHIVVSTASITGDNGFDFFSYDEWSTVFFEGVPSTTQDVVLAFGNVALTTEVASQKPESEYEYKVIRQSTADLYGNKNDAASFFFSDSEYLSQFNDLISGPINVNAYEFLEFDFYSNKADILNISFVTYNSSQTTEYGYNRSKAKSVNVNLGWNHIVLPINASFLQTENGSYNSNSVAGVVISCNEADLVRLTNLAFAVVDSSISFDLSGDPTLTHREDFLWGSLLHAPAWGNSFKEGNLELQLKQMADMGCKLLRVDANLNYLPHLDKTVKLCNAYGIKVMIIGYFPKRTANPDEYVDYTAIEDRFRMLATRYDGKHGCGKADYIQIDNELDNMIIHYSGLDGTFKEIEDYPLDSLEKVAQQVESAINGVKSAKTDIKTVINIAWIHYGMLKYFQNYGIDWDVTGHDWYDNMFYYGGDSNEKYASGEELYNLFGKPILICETNMFMNVYNGNVQYPNYNEFEWWNPLIEAFEDYYSKDFVIGCITYEFYDEPILQTGDVWSGEAHFGMVETDVSGNFKRFKPVYYRCQKVFGGSQTDMLDWQEVNAEYTLWANYDMLDLVEVKNLLISANQGYSAKKDINYDGYVNSTDFTQMKKKLFNGF